MTRTDLLIRHEGMRLRPYRDSVGKLTIGVGRNLDDVGISEDEARAMLAHDEDRCYRECIEAFPWFLHLNLARQDVIISMVFNMGLAKFRGFKRMIAAIMRSDFDAAAFEMVDSEWACQVGRRAAELAEIMRIGAYPDGFSGKDQNEHAR